MTQFFDFVNSLLDIIKTTISSIINFIPSIFNFLTNSMDLLPTPLKSVIIGVFGVASALLIYKFIRRG